MGENALCHADRSGGIPKLLRDFSTTLEMTIDNGRFRPIINIINYMSQNKRNGIIILVISILFFATAVNMYYFSDFFMNLLDPSSPLDAQAKTIINSVAIADALVGLIILGLSMYFFKKEGGIK